MPERRFPTNRVEKPRTRYRGRLGSSANPISRNPPRRISPRRIELDQSWPAGLLYFLKIGNATEGIASRVIMRLDMSEEVKSISRRSAFSLLGLTATLGFAVPTVLTVSDAEAQTAGMERRQERRAGRHERREERRGGSKGGKDTDD